MGAAASKRSSGLPAVSGKQINKFALSSKRNSSMTGPKRGPPLLTVSSKRINKLAVPSQKYKSGRRNRSGCEANSAIVDSSKELVPTDHECTWASSVQIQSPGEECVGTVCPFLTPLVFEESTQSTLTRDTYGWETTGRLPSEMLSKSMKVDITPQAGSQTCFEFADAASGGVKLFDETFADTNTHTLLECLELAAKPEVAPGGDHGIWKHWLQAVAESWWL